MKEERVAASEILEGPPAPLESPGDAEEVITAIRDALYCSERSAPMPKAFS